MPEAPRSEHRTHKRVIGTLTGDAAAGGIGYRYLGDWRDRASNRPVESAILRENLKSRGYSEAQISAALQKLETAVDATGVTLYQANLRTYQLLRYGVQVQTSPSAAHESVHLVD